jgi:hypothetical protein
MNIIFCLPGAHFSGRFLECWTELVGYCFVSGIHFAISRQESSNIYYARNLCLGGDLLRGPRQQPFGGELDYDYLMWIDSDQVFTPQQFQRLLEHQQPIVAGVYLMSDGQHLATVREWDEAFFARHGHFQFMTLADLEGQTELIPVSYTGFGFMLIRRSVFESLEYPWFRSEAQRIGDVVEFASEDVSFCLRAKAAGHTVYIDPTVRVGHEKRVIL